MRASHILLCAGMITLLWSASFANSGSSILESFTITVQNVEVSKMTETSMRLRSDSNAYSIKLEPNRKGSVMFALSGIGYSSTERVANLCFGVTITGYHKQMSVYPVFNLDDVNREVIADGNTLKFQRIYGAIPVWFDQEVDSVNLEFFNSAQLHVNQYLGLHDLNLVSPVEVIPNPSAVQCARQSVMIGIDGSSSVDKRERKMVAKELLQFVRRSDFVEDTNAICIMEFSSDIASVMESDDKKDLVHAVKDYKKRRNKSKYTSWTNWSAAFAEAIERKPDVFIFITDGWSNWNDEGAASFSAQYTSLITQANEIKMQGTRLLFITSDMDPLETSIPHLNNFLNDTTTRVLQHDALDPEIRLNDVDLIALNGFEHMEEVDFANIFQCNQQIATILQQAPLLTFWP